MKRNFILIKGDESKVESVDKDIRDCAFYQPIEDAKKAARNYIKMVDAVNDYESCEQRFYTYTKQLEGLEFIGQSIEIRPYKNLYEALLDGFCSFNDVGMTAAGLKSIDDGMLFAVRVPGNTKSFGYVLYSPSGDILKARYAFNLDFENKTICKYLMLFAKDVLDYVEQSKTA